MSDPGTLRHVTAWLADLANLTVGNAPLADSKTKIAALASVLADDYPAAAYNRQSLTHVAGACRFFPSYAEICQHLGGWWMAHRPPQTTIAGPAAREIPKPRDPPTEAEKLLVGNAVANLRMELSQRHAAAVVCAKPGRPNANLSDGALLAEYERLASEGNRAAALRVAHIRKRLEDPRP